MTEQARETQTFTDNALGREALKGNQRVIAESREQARETPEPLTPEWLQAFFMERGWTIVMDDRPGQSFWPWDDLAAALRAATPDSAEPDDCPCGHDDSQHVHYCSVETDGGDCPCNAEYARLSDTTEGQP
jgi:hypothetical protein